MGTAPWSCMISTPRRPAAAAWSTTCGSRWAVAWRSMLCCRCMSTTSPSHPFSSVQRKVSLWLARRTTQPRGAQNSSGALGVDMEKVSSIRAASRLVLVCASRAALLFRLKSKNPNHFSSLCEDSSGLIPRFGNGNPCCRHARCCCGVDKAFVQSSTSVVVITRDVQICICAGSVSGRASSRLAITAQRTAENVHNCN